MAGQWQRWQQNLVFRFLAHGSFQVLRRLCFCVLWEGPRLRLGLPRGLVHRGTGLPFFSLTQCSERLSGFSYLTAGAGRFTHPCSARRHRDPRYLPTSCWPMAPSQEGGEAESFLLPSPLSDPPHQIDDRTSGHTHSRHPGWTLLGPHVPGLGRKHGGFEAWVLGF